MVLLFDFARNDKNALNLTKCAGKTQINLFYWWNQGKLKNFSQTNLKIRRIFFKIHVQKSFLMLRNFFFILCANYFLTTRIFFRAVRKKSLCKKKKVLRQENKKNNNSSLRKFLGIRKHFWLWDLRFKEKTKQNKNNNKKQDKWSWKEFFLPGRLTWS